MQDSAMVYIARRPLEEAGIGRTNDRMRLLAKHFDGFSDPTRLSILLILLRDGETQVRELVRELEAPQPRISSHLRRLADCGYLKVRHEANRAYYSVADMRVSDVIELGDALLRQNTEGMSCQ